MKRENEFNPFNQTGMSFFLVVVVVVVVFFFFIWKMFPFETKEKVAIIVFSFLALKKSKFYTSTSFWID